MDNRPWRVVLADKLRELEFQPWCSLRFGLKIGHDKSRLAREHFATFSLHNTDVRILILVSYLYRNPLS